MKVDCQKALWWGRPPAECTPRVAEQLNRERRAAEKYSTVCVAVSSSVQGSGTPTPRGLCSRLHTMEAAKRHSTHSQERVSEAAAGASATMAGS